jgi:hypothetical protein
MRKIVLLSALSFLIFACKSNPTTSLDNKGDMALTKIGCPAFSSPITWYINKEGNFVMKVLAAGEKAKRVREGYVLKVANQMENSFQLVDKINVGGSLANVIYQFQRVN